METAEPTPLFPLESDLRVLIVEDSKIEAKLTANLLKKNGYNVVHERVETEGEMVKAIEEHKWDIVISDFQMPNFDGTLALEVFQRYDLDIPFILVSGKIGEETAVDLATIKLLANNVCQSSHRIDIANPHSLLAEINQMGKPVFSQFSHHALPGFFRCLTG